MKAKKHKFKSKEFQDFYDGITEKPPKKLCKATDKFFCKHKKDFDTIKSFFIYAAIMEEARKKIENMPTLYPLDNESELINWFIKEPDVNSKL